MKIRLFCPFCVIPAVCFFPLHQEIDAIHFLYQVQVLRFIHLCIYLFIFKGFFVLTNNSQFCNFPFRVTFVYFSINGKI